MAFNRLEVNDLATAALDDSDQVIVGESNTYKKATVSALKNNILGASPSYTTDTEPYLMRQTAHTGVVGKCALNKLVGGSLGWNQLNNYGQNSGTNNGVTYTKTASGWTVSGTASSSNQSQYRTTTDIPCVSGHRYLCIANAVLSTNGLYIIIWRNNSATRAASIGQNAAERLVMFTGGSDWTNLNIWFHVPAGKTASNTNLVVNLIDLTAEFGSTIADYIYSLESATAGAGVAWLSKYIDLGTYHAYDTGSIQSVQATAHVTTGKNLLDVTNETSGSNAHIREYNLPNLPLGIYTVSAICNSTASTNCAAIIIFADGTNTASQFLTNHNWSSLTLNINKPVSKLRIYSANNYATSQSNTVVITSAQLEFGSTATAYEPYNGHTYPLGSDTLRGYPMLVNNKLAFDGDIKAPDGTIKRKYGIANIDDLTFTYDSTNKWLMGSSALPNSISSTTAMPNSMTDMPYDAVAANTLNVNTKAWTLYTGKVVVKDSSLTEAQLRAAISGKHIVYPLATPTTESSTSYQKIQTIDADGTESFTVSSPVPVGHETQTPDNILAALSWVGE